MNIDLHQAADILGGILFVASLAANLTPPYTWLGKACHWLALNGPAMQRAVASASKKAE